MTDKDKTIKGLKEALDSLDITNKYRLNLIRAIEYIQKEPVSEELEEAAESYAITDKVLSNGKVMINFQVEKAFKAGAEWQKAQMMKDAIDVTVHIDAGGYPYIPQMELYDYDKDIPLAKVRDKYKVVLIKEE